MQHRRHRRQPRCLVMLGSRPPQKQHLHTPKCFQIVGWNTCQSSRFASLADNKPSWWRTHSRTMPNCSRILVCLQGCRTCVQIESLDRIVLHRLPWLCILALFLTHVLLAADRPCRTGAPQCMTVLQGETTTSTVQQSVLKVSLDNVHAHIGSRPCYLQGHQARGRRLPEMPPHPRQCHRADAVPM